MKKFLLIAAVLGSAFMANAQEEFAPAKGDFSTEIQFAPFSGSKIFSNGGVLQGRYFVTNKDAFLVEFGLSGSNEKSVPDTENDKTFTKSYDGKFTLSIGYQRHFYNYKRVDLYCGGKLGYIHEFAGEKEQYNADNWTWNNNGTGNGFSLYLTTGIDFYVYKGLYLGAEINAGFEDVVAFNNTTKVCVNGTVDSDKTSMGGHKFNGGFSVQPLIRLGWKF